MLMKYTIITPVYNEEKYLAKYIESIINQSWPPKLFLLVDDNSFDNSADIIHIYSKKYNWIKYLYHPSEQLKKQGSKVISAFNYGLDSIQMKVEKNEFISKIDADLELPSNYFELVSQTFYNNPKVGLAGGFIIEKRNGVWTDIHGPDYHIRGALKSYRLSCFNEIGGLMPILGWDGLDEMKAMYNGWQTKNIDIGVKHNRIADSDYNAIELAYRRGVHNYKNGGSFFLAIVRAIVRIKNKPYLLVGLAYFIGYMKALTLRENKNVDKQLSKFINKYHYKRLFRFCKK